MKRYVDNKQTMLDLSDPELLKKLVNSLLYLFHFQGQNELAFILGYPQAQHNHQALCWWIGDILKESDWIETDQLLEYLVAQLKRQLMHWQEVA